MLGRQGFVSAGPVLPWVLVAVTAGVSLLEAQKFQGVGNRHKARVPLAGVEAVSASRRFAGYPNEPIGS